VKIYGQNLSDVLKKLPWQYKILVTISCLFILYIFIYFGLLLNKKSVISNVPKNLKIRDLPQNIETIFDPSLDYNSKSKNKGWMAFTAKTGDSRNIRIASSDAKCKIWSYNKNGFEGKKDNLLSTDGQTVFKSGIWRVETPSIVYDPDDKGKEWKLYAYKYFWAKDSLENSLKIAKHYGIVVYKYSSDPAKGWSHEKWLFSPAPNYPPPPYQQMILLHLNSLSPELVDIKSYSRPSVVYKDGYLLMSLAAFTKGDMPERIILLASKDNGNSWVYLGTPIKQSDVAGIGNYTKLAGASLIKQNGDVYLSAVLGDNIQRGKGSFIFRFDNIAQGSLKRDIKTNIPILINSYKFKGAAQGTIGGGFTAYSDYCSSGMFVSKQQGNALKFNIIKTNKKPVLIK